MRWFKIALLAPVPVLMACQADTTAPLEVPGITTAKATNTEATTRWEFLVALSDAGPTPAAIRGDGRAGDGKAALSTTQAETVSGVYENARCGVRTRLFAPDAAGSGSGDATIDPDADWNKGLRCERRFFSVTLTDAANGNVRVLPAVGPFTNAQDVWGTETVGETAMGWVLGLPDCERLIFGDRDFIAVKEGRAPVRISREADVAGKRVWTVETQPPHTARCVVWSVGEYRWTGPEYVVPYRIRITEMR